jgi:oligoendopeptidase F
MFQLLTFNFQLFLEITMTECDWTSMKPYQKRSYVPESADLENKDQVVSLLNQLVNRSITSADELKSWLMDYSELSAAVDQVSSILYIRMTCQTDDQERADRYKNYIQTIPPAVKPLHDAIHKKYLSECEKYPLDEKRFNVFDREVRTAVELFREENVPLQTEESLLSQEYQTLCGAMTVEFQGKTRTMPEMGKFLLEPDRQLRQDAWRASAERRLADKNKLEEIYDAMLKLRVQIAQNAGFANYRDYKFKAYNRFDYAPDDCKHYHSVVANLVVPVYQEILKKRKSDMVLSELRPWDTSVDVKGRPPLKPFTKTEDLISKTAQIFHKIDTELGKQFDSMIADGLLDLASRKGKAPGGYQSTLEETRKPFIFMNAVGVNGDVETLLHEGGHAFHSFASADEDFYFYRHAPMEFCEVASMSMELLGEDHLDVYYSNSEDIRRTKLEHLEGIIYILPWVATIDSFQHWIYENPNHSRAERIQKWLEIHERFMGGVVNWEGLEGYRQFLWHRQLHIFEYPFYYIEYGIAQLGALQVWVRAKSNPKQALAEYRKALSLGGSQPLPKLFETAGLQFDFSEKTIAPLMKAVMEEVKGL